MNWKDVSDDPNSNEAKRVRLDTVRRAASPPVKDRVARLEELARGKRVLDVGVVDHMISEIDRKGDQWLHGRISCASSYCLGVDILADAVAALQQKGYHVRCCDITSEDLGETFDVMIVGEVIEHLGRPSGLFEAAQRILVPGGLLVLSTPNPYYLNRALSNMRGRPWDSADHVALHWPWGIAELAERAGLTLTRYYGVEVHGARTLGGKAFFASMGALRVLGFVPEIASETMMYEFRNDND